METVEKKTPAFKLSEITAMQFKCIKQCNEIIEEFPDGAIAESCRREIEDRKRIAMNPSEVQI